ncbi:MAG TPA: hypothetical protein VMM60_08790 [Ilumatobacter sp.]|nr:hypothetical protein [Ilumatobacter sp.]
MLDDVLGNYLDTLTEREFDAPFLAILRVRGYYDIHFLHGAFEFGKDFIAKLDVSGVTYQVSFQTKGGNIGVGDWREARGQIDEMRTNNLAHPNFDASLPRRTIFVTTGRLTGAAPLSSQEYGRHLDQLGEGGFEVWDRETILGDLTRHPDLSVAGNLDEQLLRIVVEIASGTATPTMLEEYSRTWLDGPAKSMWRGALSAGVIASRCREANRLDLAAVTGLLLVRASAFRLIADGSADGDVLADVAGDLFERYAIELGDRCRGREADPDLFLGAGEIAIWTTYPIRVLRTAEVLALAALRQRYRDSGGAGGLEGQVLEIVHAQPGAAHPFSDAWAASLVPIGLVVGLSDQELFGRWATEVVRWIANRYDDSPGLAPLGATPREEVDYVAGAALEHVNVERRTTCLSATAILDLVSVFERSDLYELAVNELLAVGVFPDVVEVGDNTDQAVRDGETVTRQVNWAHDESWTPTDGWKTAAHHRRTPDPFSLCARGRMWEHLALIAVLRDRMFATTQRHVVMGAPR